MGSLKLDISLEKMKILSYDINDNFWDSYPELKNISPFKKFRLKDKKANRSLSSRLMWAFAAYVDMSEKNPLSRLPNDEKIVIIEDDFISVKFDIELYAEQIIMFRKLLLSREHSALSNLIQKLDERTELIQKTKYSIENADKLDKLISNTKGLLQAIKEMEASIASGVSDGVVKGGRIESISEQGLI